MKTARLFPMESACAGALSLALVFLLPLSATAAAPRSWTDDQDRKVEAEFVKVEAGNVHLKLATGKVSKFPFLRLSKPDQAFLRKKHRIRYKHLTNYRDTARKIDEMVRAKLEAEGLAPNPTMTQEQFVRRIYLDIAGTIPNFEETVTFLESEEKDKRTQLMNALLDSEGYVSHMFNFYADMLRVKSQLNDMHVFETYIAWLKDGIRENKSYGAMVRQMLTAQGRQWDDPAAGYMLRDFGMPLDNLSATVKIFLGTDIGCAQCHDHPFNDWTQMDFYQLAAFIGKTRMSPGGKDSWELFLKHRDRIEEEVRALKGDPEFGYEVGIRLMLNANRRNLSDDPKLKFKLPHDYQYKDGEPNKEIFPRVLFGKAPKMKSFKTPRAAFAAWLTSKENPMFAVTEVNRLWKKVFGLALHEPIDDFEEIDDAQNPELLRFLASEFKRLDFDVKEMLRVLYTTQTYRSQASPVGPAREIIAKNKYHFPGPVLRRMTAAQLWDSFLTLTVPDPLAAKREIANQWSSAITMDFKTVTGKDALAQLASANEIKSIAIYQGAPSMGMATKESTMTNEAGVMTRFNSAYLARASELGQPAKPDHFLQRWGQSDRNLIDNGTSAGSIPQILTMLNGAFTHMLVKPDSLIFKHAGGERATGGKLETIYLSVLNRYPKGKEKAICYKAIRDNDEGYGDLIWALVNTREFIFIQ